MPEWFETTGGIQNKWMNASPCLDVCIPVHDASLAKHGCCKKRAAARLLAAPSNRQPTAWDHAPLRYHRPRRGVQPRHRRRPGKARCAGRTHGTTPDGSRAPAWRGSPESGPRIASRPSRQTAHGERTAAPAGAPRLPPFRACHIDISPLSAGCPAAEAARASGRLGCRWGPPCPALLPTPLLAAGPYAGANTTLPTKPPWHPSAVFC